MSCLRTVVGWLGLMVAGSALAQSVPLSELEQAYVRSAGTIHMCVDPDWTPFERINEHGHHEGISADLIQLVAQRVGLHVALYRVTSWDESLAASKAGRCQIMSFLNRTPERDRWLIFTDPIFYDPNVIITREEHPSVDDLSRMAASRVALPRGTMVAERLRREYPQLQLILTGSEDEAIRLVSERKADMTVRSLIVAAHAIKKQGLFNLKIAGQLPDYTNQLRIGVIHQEPLLRDILDKGVRSLTIQEREAIANRHVPIKIEQGVDARLLWQMLVGVMLVLAVIFWWVRKLQRMNRELEHLSVTDRLTGLFNRMKLDETLGQELERYRRTGLPVSLILLDLDHFKEVNDRLGHQAGDQVLISIARLLTEHVRASDVVGRWGGEEFMIVCPNTPAASVLALAEALRAGIAAAELPIAESKTASFGVATVQDGDLSQDLVGRADAALYVAKAEGRNRVVAA